VAVLRLHVGSSYHVTSAAYSCERGWRIPQMSDFPEPPAFSVAPPFREPLQFIVMSVMAVTVVILPISMRFVYDGLWREVRHTVTPSSHPSSRRKRLI
jgi:hypothetical protein